MHDDQLHIDEDLARRLIVEQFPGWGHEHISHVMSDARSTPYSESAPISRHVSRSEPLTQLM